jgi:hypothetical protein
VVPLRRQRSLDQSRRQSLRTVLGRRTVVSPCHVSELPIAADSAPLLAQPYAIAVVFGLMF